MKTQKKQNSFILEVYLSGYLGQVYSIKDQSRSNITSLQEKEESNFDYFCASDIVSASDIENYKDEAIAYLKTLPGKYTLEEINNAGSLDDDIKRALSDAYNNNYQAEWLEKYFKMTQAKIDQELSEALEGISYKLLDDLTDHDFKANRGDQEFLRLEITEGEADKLIMINGLVLEDYYNKQEAIQEYINDNLSAKEIDISYVDYYGSMGGFDYFLDYFQDYQETSANIDNHRAKELAKINNFKLLAENIAPEVSKIEEYLKSYINQDPEAQKIKRQLNCLKSVITTIAK
jgi:hypothetical protein